MPQKTHKKDAAVNSRVLMHIWKVALEVKLKYEAQQSSRCVETVPGAMSLTIKMQRGFNS